MTSLERVLTTLGHKEPDYVPNGLLFSMQGAAELKLSLKDYYSKGEYIAQGQLMLRKKFELDFLYAFHYAAIEVQPWGMDVIFNEAGPVNAGEPFIKKPEDILKMKVPDVKRDIHLGRVLKSITLMKESVGAQAPIIGVVMSPFSIPVMQMGFDKYIELIYERPDLFKELMRINTEFCVKWANAQLEAGAAAICYFDPVSSTTIIPRELYLKTGFEIAKRAISEMKGPTATHFASGNCLPILDDVALTGTYIACVSANEDLGVIKEKCAGKLTVMGNLNGIDMCNWTAVQAEEEVKKVIAKAGQGGGLVLSDNHGEIPLQVKDEVLFAVSAAVKKWGKYPLDWVKDYAG